MHLYHYALIAPYWSIIYSVLYVIYSAMLHCIKWAVHYILFSVQLNAQCFNCIHCYSYTVLVFPSFYTLCYSYTCISHIVYSLFVHCIIHLVYHTTIVHHISILCPSSAIFVHPILITLQCTYHQSSSILPTRLLFIMKIPFVS